MEEEHSSSESKEPSSEEEEESLILQPDDDTNTNGASQPDEVKAATGDDKEDDDSSSSDSIEIDRDVFVGKIYTKKGSSSHCSSNSSLSGSDVEIEVPEPEREAVPYKPVSFWDNIANKSGSLLDNSKKCAIESSDSSSSSDLPVCVNRIPTPTRKPSAVAALIKSPDTPKKIFRCKTPVGVRVQNAKGKAYEDSSSSNDDDDNDAAKVDNGTNGNNNSTQGKALPATLAMAPPFRTSVTDKVETISKSESTSAKKNNSNSSPSREKDGAGKTVSNIKSVKSKPGEQRTAVARSRSANPGRTRLPEEEPSAVTASAPRRKSFNALREKAPKVNPNSSAQEPARRKSCNEVQQTAPKSIEPQQDVAVENRQTNPAPILKPSKFSSLPTELSTSPPAPPCKQPSSPSPILKSPKRFTAPANSQSTQSARDPGPTKSTISSPLRVVGRTKSLNAKEEDHKSTVESQKSISSPLHDRRGRAKSFGTVADVQKSESLSPKRLPIKAAESPRSKVVTPTCRRPVLGDLSKVEDEESNPLAWKKPDWAKARAKKLSEEDAPSAPPQESWTSPSVISSPKRVVIPEWKPDLSAGEEEENPLAWKKPDWAKTRVLRKTTGE